MAVIDEHPPSEGTSCDRPLRREGEEAANEDVQTNLAGSDGVPVWCTLPLEASIIMAFLISIFFGELLSGAAMAWCLGLLLGVAGVMWLGQCILLRRISLMEIWPVWLVVTPVLIIFILASAASGHHSPTMAIAALAVFLIIATGFSEPQVTRLLGWVGGACVLVGLMALYTQATGTGELPLVGRLLAEHPGAILGTPGEAGLFGAIAMFLLAMAGFRMIAVTAPVNESGPRVHSRTRLFSSPGLNLALIACAGTLVILVWLVAFDSLLTIPAVAAGLIVYLLLMMVKRLMWWLPGLALITVLLVVAAVSLMRPAGTRYRVAPHLLSPHVHYVLTGYDYRLGKVQAEKLAMDSEAVVPTPPDTTRHFPRTGTQLVSAVPGFVRWVAALAAVLVWCYSAFGYAGNTGARVAFAGGILALLPILVFSCLTGAISLQPAVTLAGTLVLAIAATGGDFEEELELE